MMHLTLSFDLDEGAGCAMVQVEDLDPTRLTEQGQAWLRRLLELCVEHPLTEHQLAEQEFAGPATGAGGGRS